MKVEKKGWSREGGRVALGGGSCEDEMWRRVRVSLLSLWFPFISALRMWLLRPSARCHCVSGCLTTLCLRVSLAYTFVSRPPASDAIKTGFVLRYSDPQTSFLTPIRTPAPC